MGKNPLVRCDKGRLYGVTGASTVLGQNEENTFKYKHLLTIGEDDIIAAFRLNGFGHRNSKGKEKIYRKLAAVLITSVNQMRRYEAVESLTVTLNITMKHAVDTEIIALLFNLHVITSQTQMLKLDMGHCTLMIG